MNKPYARAAAASARAHALASSDGHAYRVAGGGGHGFHVERWSRAHGEWVRVPRS